MQAQMCSCCPFKPPKNISMPILQLCRVCATCCASLQAAGLSGQGSASSHLPCEVVQLHLEVAAISEDAQPSVSVRLAVLPAPAEQSVHLGQEIQTATSASTAAGAGSSCGEAVEAGSTAAQQPEQHQATRNWDDAGRCGFQWSALTLGVTLIVQSSHQQIDLRLQQGD